MNSTPKKSDSQESKSGKSTNQKSSQSQDPKLMELFIDELKDIYWAEKHLTKAIPKMAKACTSSELAEALTNHLEQTKNQISRLEQVFEMLDQKAQAKKCDAMEGLVSEGESIVEDTEQGSATRDVGIIMASQKIEHYEIATYGCLVQIAKVLGENEISEILNETLNEEKNTDLLLTEIAENNINYEALEEK